MTARTLCALLLSAGAIGIAGCSSPDGPTAGELEVRLTTPNANDRAILLRVGGTQTAVSAPVGSNYRVLTAPLAGDTVRVVVIAPVGSALAAGTLLRLTVPDTRQAGSYVAKVLDVASATYAQRATAGYVLSVVKP
jgi:hypothetical protein